METWLFCVMIVTGSVAIALGGLYLVRKKIKPEGLRKHHELAGNLLGVVGTLNAVLLGLVILEAQSRYQQARVNEAGESSTVADIRLYAEYLPEPTRSAINDHVCKYVTLVREKEWDSPPAKQPNKEAVKEFHSIWKLVCGFEPKTEKEQNLQTSMLASTAQAFDMRRLRITSGRHGLPDILWAVLIVGCMSTVGFTYFFAGDSLKIQATMVSILSLTLSMGILVVCILGNPYVGDWKIRPEQFERISTAPFPITSDAETFEAGTKSGASLKGENATEP